MVRTSILVLSLVACGGYGTAHDGARTVAEATCERAFACRAAFPADAETSFSEQYGDTEDACVLRLGPDPAQQDAWDAAEEGGRLVYTKELAKDCAVQVTARTCEAFWAEPEPEPCAAAIAGTLALDEACTLDAVCASGLCLDGRCAGPPGADDDAEGG